MADLEKVVELLGETIFGKNLAAFLELVKKLFVDWEVEPKRLFHMLQNLRKTDLLGLIAGTHEIKAKPEPEKFALLADLGEITVPDNFKHSKCLEVFRKENRKKFYYFNDAITDKNFPNPSRILKPGDKLWVRAFKQVTPGETTSEERMKFLATQNAIHTGAQGASLVFEQKHGQLPKGFWYCSFDEKDRLWEDADGDHRVPYVSAYSVGAFQFVLGIFEYPWNDVNCVLCFCDKKEL